MNNRNKFRMELFAQVVTAAMIIVLYMSLWLWLIDDQDFLPETTIEERQVENREPLQKATENTGLGAAVNMKE